MPPSELVPEVNPFESFAAADSQSPLNPNACPVS